ncbi:MAG: BBE domain-containing protein [Pseudomonadota bacterium]|nr:BBE domain-containing protein [Pseudomonadota bacterium]
MQKFSDGRQYLNFYAQLVALKNKYDPTNLFQKNQNFKQKTHVH